MSEALNMAVPLTEARAQLGELVSKARHGHHPVTLTEHGMPVAAIIGMDDLADLQDGAAIAKHIADKAADRMTGVVVESPEDIEAALDAWDERPA
jgi:prevent-host-death family protein